MDFVALSEEDHSEMTPKMLNSIIEGCLKQEKYAKAEDLFYHYMDSKGNILFDLKFVGLIKSEETCLYQTMISAYV